MSPGSRSSGCIAAAISTRLRSCVTPTAWYDSARVAHDTRWSLDLPDWQATRAYFEAVLERSLSLLDGESADRRARVFRAARASFTRTCTTRRFPICGRRWLIRCPWPGRNRAHRSRRDIEIPAGTISLGARPGSGFVFDNEKWAHEVRLPAFAIARQRREQRGVPRLRRGRRLRPARVLERRGLGDARAARARASALLAARCRCAGRCGASIAGCRSPRTSRSCM